VVVGRAEVDVEGGTLVSSRGLLPASDRDRKAEIISQVPHARVERGSRCASDPLLRLKPHDSPSSFFDLFPQHANDLFDLLSLLLFPVVLPFELFLFLVPGLFRLSPFTLLPLGSFLRCLERVALVLNVGERREGCGVLRAELSEGLEKVGVLGGEKVVRVDELSDLGAEKGNES
jgi:hypothetical protein